MDAYLTIEHKRCALMIIDPQEKLMKAIHKADEVIKNTALMIRAAKEFSIPIMATTQYQKGIGPIVPELKELLEDVNEIDKVEFDAFLNHNFYSALKALPSSVDTLILTGVEAHICIHQTALSGKRHGYHIAICQDAVSSRNKRHKKIAIQNFRALGFKVCPAETFVFELLGRAGTREFKNLLPYIK